MEGVGGAGGRDKGERNQVRLQEEENLSHARSNLVALVCLFFVMFCVENHTLLCSFLLLLLFLRAFTHATTPLSIHLPPQPLKV